MSFRKQLGAIGAIVGLILGIIGIAPIFGWIGPRLTIIDTEISSIKANPKIGSGVGLTYKGELFSNITKYSFIITNSGFYDIEHQINKEAIDISFGESARVLEYSIKPSPSVVGAEIKCSKGRSICNINFELLRSDDSIAVSLIVSELSTQRINFISSIKDIKEFSRQELGGKFVLTLKQFVAISILSAAQLLVIIYFKKFRGLLIQTVHANPNDIFFKYTVHLTEIIYTFVVPTLPVIYLTLVYFTRRPYL